MVVLSTDITTVLETVSDPPLLSTTSSLTAALTSTSSSSTSLSTPSLTPDSDASSTGQDVTSSTTSSSIHSPSASSKTSVSSTKPVVMSPTTSSSVHASTRTSNTSSMVSTKSSIRPPTTTATRTTISSPEPQHIVESSTSLLSETSSPPGEDKSLQSWINSHKRGATIGLGVGLGVLGLIALCLLAGIFLRRRLRSKRKTERIEKWDRAYAARQDEVKEREVTNRMWQEGLHGRNETVQNLRASVYDDVPVYLPPGAAPTSRPGSTTYIPFPSRSDWSSGQTPVSADQSFLPPGPQAVRQEYSQLPTPVNRYHEGNNYI